MFKQIVELKDGRYAIRKLKWFQWRYFDIETKYWGTKQDVINEPYFSGFRISTYLEAELILKKLKVKQVSI